MSSLTARPGGSPCTPRSICATPAVTGNDGASPPRPSPPPFTSRPSETPPAPPATHAQPPSGRPAKFSASTPASSCVRLLDRGPGAEAVERAVGLKAARAFLDELQKHAHRCEADVRTSGAGAVLYPVAASIANFIDAKLFRLDAPPCPTDETRENTTPEGAGSRPSAAVRGLRRFGVGEDGERKVAP
jgi:hypothetical protein